MSETTDNEMRSVGVDWPRQIARVTQVLATVQEGERQAGAGTTASSAIAKALATADAAWASGEIDAILRAYHVLVHIEG